MWPLPGFTPQGPSAGLQFDSQAAMFTPGFYPPLNTPCKLRRPLHGSIRLVIPLANSGHYPDQIAQFGQFVQQTSHLPNPDRTGGFPKDMDSGLVFPR
ncbi:hypothetical protein KCU95_g12580, partial [Aureobasidium melanogenum]